MDSKLAQMERLVRQLSDREAIRDCLYRYARGVDRRDFGLLESSFWPDATDQHGAYNGPVAGFFPWAQERTRTWERTMHSLGQIIIELRGDEATVETYFTAFHKKPKPDGGWFDEFVAGRYLDLMTRRGEEWRIQERIVAFDWFRHMADSPDFSTSPFGDCAKGARMPDDPMYRLFALKSEA